MRVAPIGDGRALCALALTGLTVPAEIIMNRHMHGSCAAALAAGIGLAFAASDAMAIEFIQNASGACQSALPVFDGRIRKRPLAIQNEGDAPAFITCSFTGTVVSGVGGRSVERLQLYADNKSSHTVSLTCTLVDSFNGNAPPPTYIIKTINLPPDGGGLLQWDASDNGGQNYLLVANVSCNLPVGVGLTLSRVTYVEET
jgi:hypothetical protein